MIEISKEAMILAYMLFVVIQYGFIIYGLRRGRTTFLAISILGLVFASIVFFASLVLIPQVI